MLLQTELGNYAKGQLQEQEEFNNTVDYIRKATNKRPYIEKVELDEKTDTDIKVKALASDDDGEKLTYILYVGNTKEDLAEVTTLEEMEGQEVTITASGSFSESKYFKIDVKDEFVTVEGRIMPCAKVVVGSYVGYTPNTGTFKMTDTESSTGETYASLSGSDSQTTEFTTEDFNWRIWDIDETNNKLVLIADGTTSKTLTLKDAQGYNNGVKLLNDICKTCYSNGKAVGRSFNFKDIEDKLVTKPTYTQSQTYTNHDYPLIHEYEEYSSIDGVTAPTNLLTRHEQNKYYTKTEEGATDGHKHSTLSLIQNYPDLGNSPTLFTNAAYYYMTCKSGDSTDLSPYLLASRCIRFREGYAQFGLLMGSWNMIGFTGFNTKYTFITSINYNFRPVVEIPLSSVEIGKVGAGIASDPFSLEIK